MPVDTSSYRTVIPSGWADSFNSGMDRGMKMREMAEQKQKQQQMNDIFKRNMIQKPDGTTDFKRGQLMKELAGLDANMALETERMFRQRDEALIAQKRDEQIRKQQQLNADRDYQLRKERLAWEKTKPTGASSRGFLLSPQQREFWKSKGISDEQMDMAESGLAGRNPLNALNQIAEKDELSTTESKVLADLSHAKNELNLVMNDYEKDDGLVGWVDGNLPTWGNSKASAFRTRIGRFKDAYQKAITGTGAGVEEMKRLMSRLPSENSTEAEFEGKLKEAIRELNAREQTYLDTLGKSGKHTGDFQKNNRGFDSDVMNYAKKHGISPEQAQAIKDRRTGGRQ